MKPPTVKDKVLALLKSKEWVSIEDFEKLFPPKTEGHMSWGQRKRDLHKIYKIIKRKKFGCPHTWEYHLIEPERTRTENQQAVVRNNFIQDEQTHYRLVGRQLVLF